jgi:hypothetical protein
MNDDAITRSPGALAAIQQDTETCGFTRLPQANWPEGHAAKVPLLVETLERRPDFASVRLAWASGLMVVVRKEAG